MKSTVEKVIYYSLLVLFSGYLIWVWFIGISLGEVPAEALALESAQNAEPLLFGWATWLIVYKIKKYVLVFTLFMLIFRYSLGRHLFLFYSTFQIVLLHTPGWYIDTNFVIDVEWFIHVVQGAILAIAYFGELSGEFTWKLKEGINLTRCSS